MAVFSLAFYGLDRPSSYKKTLTVAIGIFWGGCPNTEYNEKEMARQEKKKRKERREEARRP